jgi:hypothetical protein
MDTTLLETACRSAGMLDSAISDGVARLRRHFESHSNPTPQLITEQPTVLRTDAPHLFPRQPSVSETGVPVGVPESVWRGLSPATKLAYAREHGYGLPMVARRRPSLQLSVEQAAALAQLPAGQRLTAYRELERQAQQQG